MNRRRRWRCAALLGAVLAASGCDRDAGRREALRGDALRHDARGDSTDANRTPALREIVDSTVFVASDSGVKLAGTFSRPLTDSSDSSSPPRWPTVLLLGGSGPQDRDGARADLPGYEPLREFTDSLTQRGLAVLRLDDRGVGGSTGRFAGATTLDFARDAAHAVAWLRARADVDATRIALVGHSEGALVALLVAARDPAIRSLVLLGAPSRPGREVARWQRSALVTGDSTSWPPPERAAVLARADSNAERTAREDPWLRTWFTLDPRVIARPVRAAVLLLHGTTDRQVPVLQAEELAAALRDGGATDVSVRRFPSTDHLLLEDPDGDPRRYALLTNRHVRGDVVAALGAWLSERLGR